MPQRPRWATRHPKEALIVAGLKKSGYSALKIQQWLKTEGHRVSEATIYDIATELNEPGGRERLLREKRKHGRTREQKDAINAVAREKRRLAGVKVTSDAVKRWVEDPTFNPTTGGCG